MKTIALLFMIFPALTYALPPVERMTASQADVAFQFWRGEPGHAVTTAGWTGSMRPYIFGGETLLMERYVDQKVEPGMLLVFARWDKPRGVLHECVEVNATRFKAKGLYCIDPDGWYPFERIKYIVRRVISIKPSNHETQYQ